jgi:hypothetical protein
MWTEGDAVLLVLADIESEEDAFNEWYDREHLPERVRGIPGYRFGRRYEALSASPKHLALYECHPDVFDTPAYRRLAEKPDPRTLHFVPLMFNSIRARTRVAARFGDAEGSVLGLMMFAPAPGSEASLRLYCARELLPDLRGAPGIVCGAVLESFPEEARPSGLPPLRRGPRQIAWIIAIESGHAERLAKAVHALRLFDRLASRGAAELDLRTYRLTYRISP